MGYATCWRALLVATTVLHGIVTNAHSNVQNSKRQVIPSGSINFEDCYVRWNIIQSGQSWQDAQVKTPVWSTTPADFTNTINNMFNYGNTNAMLWLHDSNALAYAGIFSCSSPIYSQAGLNGPNVVGSLILPSGVAKLNKVGATPGSLVGANAQAAQKIFGLANKDAVTPLTADDYAYFMNGPYSDGTGGLLQAMATWSRQYDADRNAGRPVDQRISQAFLAAVKANGDQVYVTINGLFKYHD